MGITNYLTNTQFNKLWSNILKKTLLLWSTFEVNEKEQTNMFIYINKKYTTYFHVSLDQTRYVTYKHWGLLLIQLWIRGCTTINPNHGDPPLSSTLILSVFNLITRIFSVGSLKCLGKTAYCCVTVLSVDTLSFTRESSVNQN